MIPDETEERATLYALGLLEPVEKASFEAEIATHPELRRLVSSLLDVRSALPLGFRKSCEPRHDTKHRIMRKLDERDAVAGFECWLKPGEALVVTDKHGRIAWTNDAFTAMCGYSREELRGKKPGAVLQGARTDSATVQRLREAIRARRHCAEEIVNYTKSGEPYWVSIGITPVLDQHGEPRWFVAIEQEIAGRKV